MEHFSESEAMEFLRAMFPGGLKDPALVAELCPAGWEQSPLRLAFHPTPERRYEEYRHMYETLRELDRSSASRTGSPPKSEPLQSYEEFLASREQGAQPLPGIAPEEEPAELLGLCLWDVFSDNHDVIAADNRAVHLGSFRGSGGMIADFVEQRHLGQESSNSDRIDWRDLESDYLRFYLGTWSIGGRTDLGPAYRLIFRRLRAMRADWRYTFPRLHMIAFERSEELTGAEYDPSEALARESERRRKAEGIRRTQATLDKDALAAKRLARSGPPPPIVRAYQDIYGRFPAGWPPDPYNPH